MAEKEKYYYILGTNWVEPVPEGITRYEVCEIPTSIGKILVGLQEDMKSIDEEIIQRDRQKDREAVIKAGNRKVEVVDRKTNLDEQIRKNYAGQGRLLHFEGREMGYERNSAIRLPESRVYRPTGRRMALQ